MTISRLVRVALTYVVLVGFIAVALLGVEYDLYWMCIAGAIGAGILAVYILVTFRSGPIIFNKNW